jgi:hypothetical protein
MTLLLNFPKRIREWARRSSADTMAAARSQTRGSVRLDVGELGNAGAGRRSRAHSARLLTKEQPLDQSGDYPIPPRRDWPKDAIVGLNPPYPICIPLRKRPPGSPGRDFFNIRAANSGKALRRLVVTAPKPHCGERSASPASPARSRPPLPVPPRFGQSPRVKHHCHPRRAERERGEGRGSMFRSAVSMRPPAYESNEIAPRILRLHHGEQAPRNPLHLCDEQSGRSHLSAQTRLDRGIHKAIRRLGSFGLKCSATSGRRSVERSSSKAGIALGKFD